MIKRILLDVDGVLLDWSGHALTELKKRYKDLYPQYQDYSTGRSTTVASGLWAIAQKAVNDHCQEALKEGTFEAFEALFGGRKQLERLVASAGREFWMNIPQFDWANNLMIALTDYAAQTNADIAFCTSFASWPEAAGYRTEYLNETWPGIPVVVTKDKWLLAHSEAVLIDDLDRNVIAFRENGGKALQTMNPYVEPLNVDWVIAQLKVLNTVS